MFIILILYVDDILLAANDKSLLHDVKRFLSESFEMKDLGDASYVIGIEIFRDRKKGILGLSQKGYINKVLERFGMDKCSPGPVPIQKGDKFSTMQCPKNDTEWKAMESILVWSHEKCLFHFRSAKKGFCEAATETRNRKVGTTPHINSRPSGICISALFLLWQPLEVYSEFCASSCRFRWKRGGFAL
jgi:hypothetical protein